MIAHTRRAVLVALAFGAVASPLRAQDTQYQVVDRIAAVVGTVPIPMSRIEEQMQIMRLQSANLPTDSAGLDELRRKLDRHVRPPEADDSSPIPQR